ncbi:MAG: type IX secretion system membrane protein PorP/SprF [Flavobacteriaceae bacterium]|nr:type IX secretion system membrane protein PorP/SprF [Flavobacteriaceae bacterium]
MNNFYDIYKNIVELIIIISIVNINCSFSQQDPQFSQHMYNTQIINPAYAGSRGYFSLDLLSRTQWLNLEGAPRTTSFSIDTPIGEEERMGIGLSLVRDELGPSINNRINLDYSYSINFMFAKLTFGLKAGINQLNIDFSNLNIYDLSDPVSQNDIDDKIKPNFGLGLYFNTEKYYLGISVPNLLETNYFDEINFQNGFSSKISDKIHYYLIGGYVFELGSNLKIKPSTMFKIVDGSPLQWDASLNMLINNYVTLGVSYRLDSALSFLSGFQMSEKLFIGLGYDYSTTIIKDYNDGTYEIIFKIGLFNNKTIITPRFF